MEEWHIPSIQLPGGQNPTQHDHSTLATPTLPAKAPTEGGILIYSFGNSEAVELYYVESWTILVVSMMEKESEWQIISLICLFEIRKPWIQLHVPMCFSHLNSLIQKKFSQDA